MPADLAWGLQSGGYLESGAMNRCPASAVPPLSSELPEGSLAECSPITQTPEARLEGRVAVGDTSIYGPDAPTIVRLG